MSAGVQWKNRERFKKKIALLPPTVMQAARDGLVDRAQQVTDAMKRIAPVRTGALRDSITFTLPGTDAKNDSTVTITAGDKKAFWAKWVEYGTRKTHAQPFFWPTWRAYRRTGKSKVTRRVNAAIKRLAASGG